MIMAEVELNDEKQVLVDESLLLRLVEETDVGGEFQHKSIHHFLKQLHTMGCSWRSLWKITLFRGDSEAELDPDYAKYLDDCACGIKRDFEGDEGA
tara:strand:- start:1506 stop:1793 length:288 start_codon:yes stop_codon:yes gene_type:complete